MPPKKKTSRNASKESKGEKSKTGSKKSLKADGSKSKTKSVSKTKTVKGEEEDNIGEEHEKEEEEQNEEEGGEEKSSQKTGKKSKTQSKVDGTGQNQSNSKGKGKSKDKSKSGIDITGKDEGNKSNLSKIDQANTSALKDQRMLPDQLAESVKKATKSPKISNCIVVTISNCEFSRDLNYFIALQLGKTGQKKRTEVSNNVHNPSFRTNTFTIPLEDKTLEQYQELFFSAFIVLSVQDYSREHADEEHAGEARLLGECSLNLIPHRFQLYDKNGQGIKQSMKFIRRMGNVEGTVGRFVVNVKYIGDPGPSEPDLSIVESKILQEEPGPEDNENMKYIVRPLPKSDGYNFHWRIRVDFRSAIDLMMNSTEPKSLPSTFFEVGIVDTINKRPHDSLLQVTKTIPSERNPIWNQQLLIVKHQDEDPSKQVFLYIALVNNDQVEKKPFDSLWLPINKMKPFYPYHFEFQSSTYEFKTRGLYWMSLVFEEKDPKKTLEQYADIVVHKATHSPLPRDKVCRFYIAMTLFNYVPKEIVFTKVDLEKVKTFDSILETTAKENSQRPLFLSTMLKIPPDEVVANNQIELFYRGVALFSLTSSMLKNTNIQFFLIYLDSANKTKLHFMPDIVSGHTRIANLELENLFL
jgi:hypothetical protein